MTDKELLELAEINFSYEPLNLLKYPDDLPIMILAIVVHLMLLVGFVYLMIWG